MDNSGGMTFSELLDQPGVTEHLELGDGFGFMAFHGGPVERVTSMVAHGAAAAAGASVYSIDQPRERPLHIPSTRVTPVESPTLAQFYEHVQAVCTIHGYGREREKQHVLVGGQNRELAHHVAQHLRDELDERFPVIDSIDDIPRELRGVHERNPANLLPGGGVQIELPPGLRWNWDAHSWADADGLAPTENVEATIRGLAAAARSW